jgi:mannose-6-phosphate isomerase-like protein (cupin superfamily)
MIANHSCLDLNSLQSIAGDGATVTRHLPSLPQAMQAIASGKWSVTEARLSPASPGARPHAHAQVDVVFYVLEGRPTFQLGEQVVCADVGSWVVVTRGTVHTCFNSTNEPARYLIFCLSGPNATVLTEACEVLLTA